MFRPLLLLLSLLLALGNTQVMGAAQNNTVSAAPVQLTAEKTSLNSDKPPPKEGDSIWLEKKLAPSTRWIERVITPLNRWMEQKVQALRPNANRSAAADTEPGRSDGSSVLLSELQISTIARQHTAGKVLAVKLLSAEQQQPRYRIKLLSRKGIIHILFFDAKSGTISDDSLTGGP